MANIMVNDVCNLKCPYCFANEYVNGDTTTDISYANFKKAVDWINGAGEGQAGVTHGDRVALIGGEPLLHPQFEDLIMYAVNERRPEQMILVFTNGLCADKYIDLFSKNHISLLINLNSPEDIGREKYEKTVENLRKMRMKGVDLSLGINFYKGDLDTTFALDVIKEFGFDELRVGITSPNSPEKIKQGSFAYYEEIKEPIMKLIRECAKEGCGVHFDCQKIPLCIMKDYQDELIEIEEKHGVQLDVYSESACTPVIDILTDLQIVRCFGISEREHSVAMDDFVCEDDVSRYFQTNFDCIGFFQLADEKCLNCYERNIGQCQGGCLSYKAESVYKIVKTEPVSKSTIPKQGKKKDNGKRQDSR